MNKQTLLKNLIPYAAILGIFCSCHALKPASYKSAAASGQNDAVFIENISVSPAPAKTRKTSRENAMPELTDDYSYTLNLNNPYSIENTFRSQFKFALLLDVDVESLENETLYNYIDEWWGTPYRLGGSTRRGIDCSAFVQGLLVSVYGISAPRVAREQKNSCEELDLNDLKEGDLVFFNTRGGVSHVGVYLRNNRFVHASVSEGVTISDLNDSYWKRRYLGAGRPKQDEMVRY